ncbi:MAG: RnfABCDGE type electron transport complex subunit D [Clostridia bacterium]|nr:RnfABCDGE type electron transport complex subunit D [Clostridia bacterium]
MSRLIVSSSPHIRTQDTTQRIMLDVLIALLPTSVAGCIIFGWRALLVLVSCVASAVLAEFVFNKITKKENTITDLSAAVTGLLLGLNLHAQVPIWQCVVGSVFAIIVVKCLFGGLGCNFANPAITGRIFMLICFAGTVGGGSHLLSKQLDLLGKADLETYPTLLMTSATPLTTLNQGSVEGLPSLLDMFLGNCSGAIGEVSALALLIGFAYLVYRRVIHFETPLVFIATVFVGALIITGSPLVALYHVLAGGLLIGAIFMATDYVTTPITRAGKMIFCVGAGLITVLIRFYGSYPEGVSFSILLMNILSPYIEKWTAPKALGGKKA